MTNNREQTFAEEQGRGTRIYFPSVKIDNAETWKPGDFRD